LRTNEKEDIFLGNFFKQVSPIKQRLATSLRRRGLTTSMKQNK
jgi:hypothetical protein